MPEEVVPARVEFGSSETFASRLRTLEWTLDIQGTICFIVSLQAGFTVMLVVGSLLTYATLDTLENNCSLDYNTGYRHI